MKRVFLFSILLGAMAILPSCGVAEGLGKALGRTANSASRSVSNLGGALGR